MSNYNSYARKLDTAFKTAREAYTGALDELKKAKNEYSDKAGYRAGEPEYNWKARKAEAELKLAQAEEKFNTVGKAAWKEYKAQAEALTAELTSAIMGDGLADPAALDTNAVELLKAGVLTVADIENFAAKYDTNPTMLKLISKYAKDMSNEATDATTRQRLNMVAIDTATGTSRKVREFEELVHTSYIYAGLTRDNNSPEFVADMAGKWDSAASMVDNF